jgi:hypothetical protein
MARRPADPEEELRWMSQEVRGYVEAVLNSLAANVPKVHIVLSISCYGLVFVSNFHYLSMLILGYCALPSGESKGRHA